MPVNIANEMRSVNYVKHHDTERYTNYDANRSTRALAGRSPYHTIKDIMNNDARLIAKDLDPMVYRYYANTKIRRDLDILQNPPCDGIKLCH